MAATSKRPLNPSKIATEWFGWVEYGPVGESTRSAASCHGSTVPELVADAYKTAIYYASLGYAVQIKLYMHCAACHGAGHVYLVGDRQRRTKRCAACKGHGELASFEPIPLTGPYSGIKITNDCL